MTAIDILGYFAGVLVLVTFSMTTMVHLRIIGILSNVFFIAYGYLDHATPILLLHSILLPLNILRLRQIMSLLRKVEEAARGNPDLDLLKSISTSQKVKRGQTLFRKGDVANSMMFIVAGIFRIEALGIDVTIGDVIGEIALLAPNSIRTQTVVCIADGEILEIGYQHVKQLYFQNPKFGFYLLQLAGRRLLANVERLESELARERAHERSVATPPA